MRARTGFVSNSSSSSFILRFAEPFKEFAKNYDGNGLRDLLRDDKEDLETTSDPEYREHIMKNIKEIEEQLEQGCVSIRVQYGAEESFEELLGIMIKCGVIEGWETGY